MSRALGAAFLHHQVEQLERTISSNGPTSGNWRERKGYTNGSTGSGRRGPVSPGTKSSQRKKLGGDVPTVTRERVPVKEKELNRNHDYGSAAIRRSIEQDRKEKDADIVVVDGSVLIHALYQVKKWCRDGREEVIIVPLEGSYHTTIEHLTQTHSIMYSAQYIGSIEERDIFSRSESSCGFSDSRGPGWD